MTTKEKIAHLLQDVRGLEKLLEALQSDEELSMRTLAETGNRTLAVLEAIKQLEAEQIRLMGERMAEQQEELLRLTALFTNYQESADRYREHIRGLEKYEEATAPAGPEAEPKTAGEPETVEPEPQPETSDVAEKTPDISPEMSSPRDETPVVSEPTLPEPEKVALSLHDILEKRQLADLRKAFSLNDHFRFRRELFAGSEERMSETIARLNGIHTYEESLRYLSEELRWDLENSSVADFIKLLEKRFI